MIESTATQNTLDALSAVLTKSASAGEAVLTKAYGAGTDSAAVKLAVAAVRQFAGLTKPGQGGTAQRTNNVVKALRSLDTLTDSAAVAAARVVLDAHRAAVAATRAATKAAKAADSEARAAAKSILNDRTVPVSQRRAAFDAMTEIDSKSETAKSVAALAAFVKACETFAAAGYGLDAATGILADVFAPVSAPALELVSA